MKCKSFIAQFKISENWISSFKYFSKQPGFWLDRNVKRTRTVWNCCSKKIHKNISYKVIFQREKNKHIFCRPRSVRIGKNCALGLEHGPWPAALCRTQDLGHSFSQYGPPGRQITYISVPSRSFKKIYGVENFCANVLDWNICNILNPEYQSCVRPHCRLLAPVHCSADSQYSPVQFKQVRLLSILLYGTQAMFSKTKNTQKYAKI